MARIRSIKPELRTDLDVGAWPIPARYAWALLWGYLDDSGRGFDDDRLLVADLFPLDRDITEKKFANWKKLWVAGGQVCRYEIDGVAYLHAVNWDNHQRINRPTGSRLPPCPKHGPSCYDKPPGSLNDSLNDSVSHSLNGSLNGSHKTDESLSDASLPRAQARVPAEQGAGKGAGKGAGSSEQGTRAPREPAGGHPAEALLEEHQAHTGHRLANGTRSALLGHISEGLDRATPEQVRAALTEHRRRPGAKPGLLPHLLDDVLDANAAATLADDPTSDPEIQAWIAAETAKAAAR